MGAVMDIEKLLAPAFTLILGGVCTWAARSGVRAFKNRGKTDVEIALEAVERESAELEAAISAQRIAHENADPSDDAAADARVARERMELEAARMLANRARRLASMLDGLVDPGEP
jgi:hypothetical protein